MLWPKKNMPQLSVTYQKNGSFGWQNVLFLFIYLFIYLFLCFFFSSFFFSFFLSFFLSLFIYLFIREKNLNNRKKHCVKNVRIRSYSGPNTDNSVRMRENTNQNNSEYGHFSRSESINQYTPRTPNDIFIYGCREI